MQCETSRSQTPETFSKRDNCQHCFFAPDIRQLLTNHSMSLCDQLQTPCGHVPIRHSLQDRCAFCLGVHHRVLTEAQFIWLRPINLQDAPVLPVFAPTNQVIALHSSAGVSHAVLISSFKQKYDVEVDVHIDQKPLLSFYNLAMQAHKKC
jgi:hypothetical protein